MNYNSTYAKPYLSVRKQVELLACRGMDVGPTEDAERLLRQVGYYRLSGYWYPYRQQRTNSDGRVEVLPALRPGTTLKHVQELYAFDRQIRLRILDALEIVEVALRFQVGHSLGRRDAFAHRDPLHLDPAFAARRQQASEDNAEPTPHEEWLKRFDEQERRSQEQFAKHFRMKYGPHLPVWVATEVMTFGTLGQLYSGATQVDRERIAASLDLFTAAGKGDAALLSNWFNHIRYIRNICAHHARVWNRTFDIEIAATTQVAELAHLTPKSRRRAYGTVAVLAYLLARVEPSSDWRHQMRNLIVSGAQRLCLSFDELGFPTGWQDQNIWKADYARDPILARRALLITNTTVTSTAATKGLLHSREPDARRSWLRYLRNQGTLVAVSFGGTQQFPTFQIDDTAGDIIPVVGDINAELHKRAEQASCDPDDANWTILEWWVNRSSTLGDSPEVLIRTGDLDLEQAQLTYPIFQKPEQVEPVD